MRTCSLQISSTCVKNGEWFGKRRFCDRCRYQKGREYMKKYQATHVAKSRSYNKRYRDTHKAQLKEYKRKYWAAKKAKPKIMESEDKGAINWELPLVLPVLTFDLMDEKELLYAIESYCVGENVRDLFDIHGDVGN